MGHAVIVLVIYVYRILACKPARDSPAGLNSLPVTLPVAGPRTLGLPGYAAEDTVTIVVALLIVVNPGHVDLPDRKTASPQLKCVRVAWLVLPPPVAGLAIQAQSRNAGAAGCHTYSAFNV